MPIDEIEVIKQKLVDQIKPIGVYLFGSFANGTAYADSDFDFYIIVDDSEKDLHAVATSAYKAIRGVKPVSYTHLVRRLHQFEKLCPAILCKSWRGCVQGLRKSEPVAAALQRR